MEPYQNRRLVQAIQTGMHRLAEISPVYTAILSGWLAQPSSALAKISDQYSRILSTSASDLTLLLAGLHHLALKGDAARLAPFCASCGGQFRLEQASQVAAAAEADLRDNLDDLLDFMLGQEARREPIEAAPLLLLGSLVTAAEYGGSISLVEIGCGGGSRLLFDQYRYQFGPWLLDPVIGATTDAAVRFNVAVDGPSDPISRLLAIGMPQVTSRRGLSAAQVDLTSRDELQLFEAFIPPDDMVGIGLLRGAAAELTRHDRLDVRQGDPETDLLSLLAEAYDEMPPGTTLLLADLFQWSGLRPEVRQRVAFQVQSFVARLQPHKPVAWLQVDRLNPSLPKVEARLHLFGWADPEDRSVRRLAEASPDLTRLRWMG